ncbi:MAG: hypothetical protein K5985_01965 [Lachnospiraceae bacterium]|nr:hypothetical protein [Lachnospiraceae bacterium]
MPQVQTQQQNPYEAEKAVISTYEAGYSQTSCSQTELSYRHMNTRFSDLEKASLSGQALETAEKEHKTRRTQIEADWHKNTGQAAERLMQATGNYKEKAYYARFDLKQLEILIKNSDRGGNSGLYNNVASDLELFNAVESGQDTAEMRKRLNNLMASCREYIKEKNPWTTKGKIRKYMIEHVLEKAKEKLVELDEAHIPDLQECSDLYDEYNADTASDEKLNASFRAYFKLFSESMKDGASVTIPEEHKATVQGNMIRLLNVIKGKSVDQDQCPSLATRFFNAIGWSRRVPTVATTDEEMQQARANSPIKRFFYHCLRPLRGQKDALSLAKQVIGANGERQYLSDGRLGQGTYLLAGKKDSDLQRQGIQMTADEIEKENREVDWYYGRDKGSVQLTMAFKSRARAVELNELMAKIRVLKTNYEDLYNNMFDDEREKYIFQRYIDFPEDILRFSERLGFPHVLTVFAALLGYNAVLMDSTLSRRSDVYNIMDRSILVVSNKATVRKDTVKRWEHLEPKSTSTEQLAA